MQLYNVSAWDILYKLPRGVLETIARDSGIKDPHLSTKPDLIERLVARCDFKLAAAKKATT